ncbi:metal-dependent hydrolase [Paenibacillus flagellatus]|uniref:Metal-dependent hydrolase n=1 Tax=Paenibacillus flagellatus TaxID=2211139 RepID=A0A2V5KCK2_9BACL|nr:metal-dependent hydrolase [Paenibacillus flagellatus]PYI55894.1 metal-dependent hydrolase [Paenibacillus flagellatus]
MDTGSHLLFGATIAGLACVDPVVAARPELALPLLVATTIGSHAPDFDAVARLRGYSAYIRAHRGVTHSLPALAVWPLVIALPVALAFGVGEFALHLYGWTFAAVCLHVLLDLFNAYGVQCLRPFSRRWMHLDVLPLFDPFLAVLHAGALLAWALTDVEPTSLFPAAYAATFLYIALRAYQKRRAAARIRRRLRVRGVVHLLPCIHWFRWQYVLESDDRYYTGQLLYGRVSPHETYGKEAEHAVIEATRATGGVRAFLQFAKHVHVSFDEREDGYEVRWRDVRFCYDRNMPFGADVRLDRQLNVVSESVGWRKKAWDPPYV